MNYVNYEFVALLLTSQQTLVTGFMNYSDSHTHKCITVFQSTSDQAQITAEWIAAALKQITDELHQLAASLDARKAADNARVSV